MALSRDDAGRFLPISRCEKDRNLQQDPFSRSIRTASASDENRHRRRPRQRPNLKIGICGEHGGDPASVKFCHKIGLNYVSCSPYRVQSRARRRAGRRRRRDAKPAAKPSQAPAPAKKGARRRSLHPRRSPRKSRAEKNRRRRKKRQPRTNK